MGRAWRDRVRRLGGAIGPPLLALALAESVLWVGAFRNGDDPRRGSTWVHWDSYRYLDIAGRGYVVDPDDPLASNTGWFPGYPAAVRIASRALRVRPARAGRAEALLFELGLLTLLWTRLLPPVSRTGRWLALLSAAFFPAWCYRHAVFPLSMTTFFALAAIVLAADQAFLSAGACGAAAAFTYPTGFLVAVPLALAAAGAPGLAPLRRARALAAGAGLTLLGLVAVFVVLQAKVGRWDAFLRYQERFGQGLFNPFAVLALHAGPLLRGSADPATLVAFQTVLTTALLLLAGCLLLLVPARRPVELLLLAHAACVWAFVNAAGPNVSIYRQAAVLVGLVPLLARLAPSWLAILLAVLVALGFAMARLFFGDVLI
jgi:hypothetical protein